jgi:hypothetical protein
MTLRRLREQTARRPDGLLVLVAVVTVATYVFAPEPGRMFVFAGIFILAFLIGARSTLRLWGTYQRVAPNLVYRDRLILQAFVVASVTITLAAGYFGAFSVRRILDYPPIDWQPPVSALVAAAVLLLPRYFDRTVDRIARAR